MLVNRENLNIFFRAANAGFNKAMDQAKTFWNLVAMEVPSTSEAEAYGWMGAFPMMREWLGDRLIKNLKAYDYAIKNKDFEATIQVPRNNIEDDTYGIFRPMFEEMGRVAAQHPDILIFQLMKDGFTGLCYDGRPFFDADHPVGSGEAPPVSVSNTGGGDGTPWFLLDLSRAIKPFVLQRRSQPKLVAQTGDESDEVFMRKVFKYGVDDRKNVGYGLWQLAYGSKQALDGTSYKAARSAMSAFKNDEGVPLGIMSTHLVVPPDLEEEGKLVVGVQTLENGAGNPWYGTAELVVVPWLA